jgi:lysylphosphatidylglycerol synthetase-like protein (DUF2156 family)
MRLSTAVRIASLLIIAKAVLIGTVYWRRAEIINPAGPRSCVGLSVIVAIVVAIAAVLYTVSRRSRSARSPECVKK